MERGIAELMFKANEDIRKICDQKLHQLYGKIVPDEILERLNAELAGIIDNGYESYYFIAQNIARISLGKGYMTGARGTLAGSFVAYLMGITDINPLPEKYGGYNIPPEVHYGIDYSKKPEIVFNVAPEIRDDIVADLKQLDGVGDIVRFKVDKDYHPTAFLIIPECVDLEGDLSVDEYEKCFYRFDLCEHKGLQMLKHLQEETGVNPLDILLDDKKLLSLFKNCKALGIEKDDLLNGCGGRALPEYGTTYIREEILPFVEVKSISDLIKVIGFAYGTGTWEGNAKELLVSHTTDLSGCISSRDDVLLFLRQKGIDKELSYEMMEFIRKGKAKRLGLPEDWKETMREHDIPEWYIDSCEKIEYLFPKAHATSYALMDLRILYYKLYYPEAFYKAWLDIYANRIPRDLVTKGYDYVKSEFENAKVTLEESIIELEDHNHRVDEDVLKTSIYNQKIRIQEMYVLLEMFARGVDIIQLNK